MLDLRYSYLSVELKSQNYHILHSLVEKKIANIAVMYNDNKNEHFGTNAIGRNYIESRVAYKCR